MTREELAKMNTDREIWREREDDYYADSIHVTENGGIGINCGGHVIVKPIREWHKLAALSGVPQLPALKRPDCYTFAMDFLGGSEAVELHAYIVSLETALGIPPQGT